MGAGGTISCNAAIAVAGTHALSAYSIMASNNITSNGTTTLTGAVTVAGATQVNNTLTVKNNVIVEASDGTHKCTITGATGDIDSLGHASFCDGNIILGCNSGTFADSVYFKNKQLWIADDNGSRVKFKAAGHMYVYGTDYSNGYVLHWNANTGDFHTKGTLTVDGDTTLNSDLSTTGTTVLNGNVTLGVSGNTSAIYVKGTLSIAGNNLLSGYSAQFSSFITAAGITSTNGLVVTSGTMNCQASSVLFGTSGSVYPNLYNYGTLRQDGIITMTSPYNQTSAAHTASFVNDSSSIKLKTGHGIGWFDSNGIRRQAIFTTATGDYMVLGEPNGSFWTDTGGAGTYTFTHKYTFHENFNYFNNYANFVNRITNHTNFNTTTIFIDPIWGGVNGVYGTFSGTVTCNNVSETSDINLKENILEAPSQWEVIKGYRFRNYNYIGDTETKIGLISQESPDCAKIITKQNISKEGIVTTETLHTIQLNRLIMQTSKALQEALLRIETLEATVAILQNSG